MRLWATLLIACFGIIEPADAMFEGVCNLGEFKCGRARTTRSASANPSSNSRISINPSAVPTERGLGIEAIGYKNLYDLGLVRGLGRVGAAITPSNSEETFFGAPAYESDVDFLNRKRELDKYRGKKVTLATAFNLFEHKKSALRRFSLNLGVLGKYNQDTYATTGGAGLNGILGPFTFGYSAYRDETKVTSSLNSGATDYKVQSIVENYSLGLYLNVLVIDYSTLRLQNSAVDHVDLITGSLLFDRWSISISERREYSRRNNYDFETKNMFYEEKKVEQFYGGAFKVTGNFMVGIMYNYYLLRELSGSVTLMF